MARFNSYDVLISLCSLISYVTDVATDIALVVYFFTIGEQVWGALTVSFMAMSMLMMQVFSFHWHAADGTLNWKTLIAHILFLSPLHRYIRVLQLGFHSRKTRKTEDVDAAYSELNDVCILRLFETFLEAAPQLVLQLYIVLIDLDNFNTLIGFSLFFSLMSVSWAVTAYTDALHLAFKKLYKRRFVAMVMHVLWQTGMVTARIVSIVLFATVFHAYVTLALGLHFVIMLAWITRLNPEFGSTPCQRSLFTVISSVIHCFCFLNLKDGRSRYRMAFYYILMLIETAAFMTVWYLCKQYTGPVWFEVTAFSVVFGSFGFGTLCMLLYYGCCHPSGPAPISDKKPEFLKPSQHQYRPANVKHQYQQHQQAPANNKQVADASKPTIFDVSSASARINLWLSASLDLSKEGLVSNPDDLLDSTNQKTDDTGSYRNQANPGQQMQMQKRHISPEGSAMNRSAERPLLGAADPVNPGYHGNMTSMTDSREQEHSMSDYNIIQLFSQCKLDPSFVSDSSMLDDTPDYARQNAALLEQQNSLTEIPRTRTQPSRLSNDSARSLTHDRSYNSREYQGRRRNEQHNSLTDLSFEKGKFSRISNESSSSLVHEKCPVHNNSRTSSLNRSLKSPMYREQNNSLTEISMRVAYQSRVSNESAVSLVLERSPKDGSCVKLSPVNISPLDPGRLWEESRGRLGRTSSPQEYSEPVLSDADHSREKNAIITVTPDVSRGITHLSLSYSDLNSAESAGINISSRNSSVQSGSTSLVYRHEMNKSLDCLSSSKHMRDSRILSFSDMSLQLPDNSSKSFSSPNNQPDLDRYPSQDSSIGRRETRSLERQNFPKSSTLNGSVEKRSVESLSSSRDYSSSFYSLRGSSGSDRMLCSSRHTHETSSGFQSEDSNLSTLSPMTGNACGKNHKPFQSTPIAENEISSIPAPQTSSVVNKRTSLDTDVVVNSSSGQVLTPVCPIETKSSVCKPAQGNLFFVENELDALDSPVLPPIRLSRRSSSTDSSGSSRFFKDPTLDEELEKNPENNYTSESDSKNLSSALYSRKRNSSTYMDKSSLSALLSDLSSSKNGEGQSSEESLALSSGTESLNRMAKATVTSESSMRKTASLPYLDDICSQPSTGSTSGGVLDTYTSLPHPRRVSDYLCKNQQEKQRLQELYCEFSEATSGRVCHGDMGNQTNSDYVNVNSLQKWSPKGYGSTPALMGSGFNRDHLRTSLDKETGSRLVADIEKLAPKKLYELKAKSDVGKKKVSPVNVTEYTESPYKFRKSRRESAMYEDRTNVSRDSIGNEVESSVVNNMLHADYENFYIVGDGLSGCPLATPESLSDAVFLDDANQLCRGKGMTCNEVRGELLQELLPDGDSLPSGELLGTKSPINVSGINSAFKPVRKSFDSSGSNSHAVSDATFTVSDKSSEKSFENLTEGRDSLDTNRDSLSGLQTRRRSDCSQFSLGTESSSFQWSQGSDTDSFTGESERNSETSRNYLKLAGRNALSFSSSVFLRDDVSSQGSQHSYTDSIPWDETENKSLSFQNPDKSKSSSFQNAEYSNVVRSCPRQPLKALENTPVFSPIYGKERRECIELSSRKRFMSTPKLSTGSELSTSSRNSEDESVLSMVKTPHRRRSSGVGKKSFSDNTSTWSTQSESEADRNLSVHEHSTFALSKTQYI